MRQRLSPNKVSQSCNLSNDCTNTTTYAEIDLHLYARMAIARYYKMVGGKLRQKIFHFSLDCDINVCLAIFDHFYLHF